MRDAGGRPGPRSRDVRGWLGGTPEGACGRGAPGGCMASGGGAARSNLECFNHEQRERKGKAIKGVITKFQCMKGWVVERL
jgi:hypothetical protein